jgi:hypothetical protein
MKAELRWNIKHVYYFILYSGDCHLLRKGGEGKTETASRAAAVSLE